MESTNGSVSIEASISLPIYIIILMTFIYLLYMFEVSDEISFVTSSLLAENYNEEYLTSKTDSTLVSLGENLLLKNKIDNEVEKLNLRIDNYSSFVESDEEFISSEITYDFIMPFKLFNNGRLSRTKLLTKRKFQNGMSLEDYQIVSKKIDAGFDVWSLENYERAVTISNMLGGTDTFNGNGIDKIENGKAVAIVSLDYRKNSYADTEKISQRVNDEIDKLVSFKTGFVGNEFVSENSYSKKVLELVIPDGEISPELQGEFIRIKTIASNKGIGFKITQIGG